LSATIAGFCVKAAHAARPKASLAAGQRHKRNFLALLEAECRGKQRETSLLAKVRQPVFCMFVFRGNTVV
jgi:hypothetical protein